MNEVVLKSILIEDWIKFVLIICALLIIAARFTSGEKFQHLIKFWNIHRYFIYKTGQTIPIITSTNILMFFNRVFTSSILILYLLNGLFSPKINWDNFLLISVIISIFIGLKYIIEKTLSRLLGFSKKLTEINRYRIALKNLFSLHLYFFLIFMIFNDFSSKFITKVSAILILIYTLLSYSFVLKKYSPNNPKSLIYFISYLCAFEIAPILILVLYLINIGKL